MRYRCIAEALWSASELASARSLMAALTFGTSNSPEPDPRRGALLRLLDTLAEWQMRHSHRVICRGQPAQRHHHQRDPAVERDTSARASAPATGRRASAALACARQHARQHDTRIRRELPRQRRRQPLQRPQQDIRQHQIERRARDDLAARAGRRRARRSTSAPTPLRARVVARGPHRLRVDVGGEHRHAQQLRRGDREHAASRCRDRGCGAAGRCRASASSASRQPRVVP